MVPSRGRWAKVGERREISDWAAKYQQGGGRPPGGDGATALWRSNLKWDREICPFRFLQRCRWGFGVLGWSGDWRKTGENGGRSEGDEG